MEHRFEIFDDYFQFYLQDDDIGLTQQPQDRNERAVERMLVTGPHLIGVGTARNMTVPVTVRICEARPDIADADFERINECAIQIDTGRLVIAGCTDYFPDAARIDLAPGTYNALIGYKGLDTLSEDGPDGDDSYHIFLWRR
jgi:hypothetical protein